MILHNPLHAALSSNTQYLQITADNKDLLTSQNGTKFFDVRSSVVEGHLGEDLAVMQVNSGVDAFQLSVSGSHLIVRQNDNPGTADWPATFYTVMNQGDTAAAATKLATSRTFPAVNLAGTGGSSFDGSANPTALGVTSTLPINHGGTGSTTAAAARTALGITAANLGAVAKAGDTMTGNLTMSGATQAIKYASGTRTGSPITFYAGDQNGSGIVIGDGGRTIIGAGESASALRTALGTTAADEGKEELHLASDGPVYIHTNGNTIANRKTVTINMSGNISAPGGFTGSLSGKATSAGTADSATKLTTARTFPPVNLAGTSGASFDGSANPAALGVTGTLPVGHGGTGNTTGTAQYLASHSIAENTNLNSLTIPGLYHCPANATVAKLTNCPTTQAFTMLVSSHAGTSQLLIEYPTAAYKIYHRNYYNNSWGSWIRIYTTSDKPTASDVGALASGGTAAAATKLATARSLKTNLGSTTAVTFDGSAAQDNIPITGTLAVAHGGTGVVSLTGSDGLMHRIFDSTLNVLDTGSLFIPAMSDTWDGGYLTIQNIRNKMGFGYTLGALAVSYGGTGATTAADARNYLGITPGNIGAVYKSGDTMTGDLVIKSGMYSSFELKPTDRTSYGRAEAGQGKISLQAIKSDSPDNRHLLDLLDTDCGATECLRLSRCVSGSWTYYNVLTTANSAKSSVVMAPMEDNAITTVDVLFEHEFDSIPSVVASAVGDTPGDTVVEVRNISTTGATLAMRTTATDPVRVDWIASAAETPPPREEPPTDEQTAKNENEQEEEAV